MVSVTAEWFAVYLPLYPVSFTQSLWPRGSLAHATSTCAVAGAVRARGSRQARAAALGEPPTAPAASRHGAKEGLGGKHAENTELGETVRLPATADGKGCWGRVVLRAVVGECPHETVTVARTLSPDT